MGNPFKVIYPTERMNTTDFNLFRKMIYAEAGINLTEKKITLLSNRIRKRLKALKMASYHDYYMYLKKSINREIEIVKMINEVTTNVTHFFRNPKQFDILKNIIIPDIIKKNRNKKNIKILSAGCSSGEEPYTLSIILLEHFINDLPKWHIEIEGVDISTDIINRAREGIYKNEKLNKVDNKIVNKYFTQIDNEYCQISKKAKSIIKFSRFNLKSDNFSSKYDIILCRNVVIYFDSETKNNIYQKFYNALQKHGYFLVGHSEGLLNDNRFKFIKPGVYIKN